MQLCHNIIYSPGDGRPGNQCCFGYYCYYPFVYMAFFAMCYDPLIQFPSKRTLWLIPRLLHAGDDAQWEIKSSISPKDHLESPLLRTDYNPFFGGHGLLLAQLWYSGNEGRHRRCLRNDDDNYCALLPSLSARPSHLCTMWNPENNGGNWRKRVSEFRPTRYLYLKTPAVSFKVRLTSLFSQFCKRLQIRIVAKTRNLMTNFPTLEKRFPSFHSLPWDFNGIECTFFTLKLNSRRKVITIHLCNFFLQANRWVGPFFRYTLRNELHYKS